MVLIVLASLVFISADDSVSGYCCEKLSNNGLLCQNVLDSAQCDQNFEVSFKGMSCDQTSFCTLGTCVDQVQGICSENVPQQKCKSDEGGYWTSDPLEEVNQCQVGCCTYGDSAALVTETRCILLSADSGLEADFNNNIVDEASCIASIPSNTKGACVYENDLGTRKCQITTHPECTDISKDAEFYEGELCSNPSLETICGMTENTVCSNYDVYFVDSCGNIANIYDSNKVEDTDYWTTIQDPTCDDGFGNKNSVECGACEPNLGSKCGNYKETNSQKPDKGTNICASLDCEYNGETYLHGESWCAQSPILSEIDIEGDVGEEIRVSNPNVTNENLPGSRYTVLECRNGQVLETACDGFRNEVCAETYYDINDDGNKDDEDYTVAACVANRWQGCKVLINKEDCEDSSISDCQWIDYGSEDVGLCAPKFAPGFDFWEESTSGAEICKSVSTSCTIKYEVSIIRNPKKNERVDKCVENCYCIPGYEDGDAKNKYENKKPSWHPKSYEEWISKLDLMCSALGDCGSKVNYIGESGSNLKEVVDTSQI